MQLAISGLKGTTIGNDTETLTQKFNKVKGTHGFYPDHKQIQTGFVALGPGLKKGTVIPVMNMVDIAPFICKLTGVTLPAADGKVYPEMFQ